MIELLLNAESQLALGLLDQAEQTYRTVLEADPRNGIAAVGLSRVALERGDDAGAHALARAALEIDPENATARRMIDRLEEVARYRDAAVAAVARPDDPPADPPADDSEAMIRASGIPGGAPEDPSGARETDGGRDVARPAHVESSPGHAKSAPGASTAPPPAAPAGVEQESSTHGQQPGPSAGPPGIPSAGPREPAPARPGLLRRITRRS